MDAIIRDNVWIYLNNITTYEEDIIWNNFSVSKDNKYIDPMQVKWDGIHRKYNRLRKRIARPLLAYLRQVCEKFNLPLVVIDERQQFEHKIADQSEITSDYLPGIKLEEYQINAIKKSLSIDCGIYQLPTGSGKTEIISGLCKAIKCPTVILADMKVIVDQIKARLELRDVVDDVGVFYAGKRPNGQLIVVGSAQSLMLPNKLPSAPKLSEFKNEEEFIKAENKYRTKIKAYKTRLLNAKKLREYILNAEMIIADECDRSVSGVWKDIFKKWFTGRKRFGFSATPIDEDKPVEALTVQEHLGSIVFQENLETVQNLGRIIPCHYIMIAFGMSGSIKDCSAYDIAINDWIVNNNNFHTLIKNMCSSFVKTNNNSLIIVDRDNLGESLNKILAENNIRCDFIHGKTSKKNRDLALRAFERKELDVLIGGKIINRGLDLKGGCDNLIITTGGKLRSEFLQKVGRALRVNESGMSRVFDFYYRCNKYLYEHSRKRLQFMVDLNYQTTIMFPNGHMSGNELIDKRFRIPKQYL